METVDWVMLFALLASMVLGAWRGLVYETVSVAGWIAAFVAAQWFADDVAAILPIAGGAESMRYAAGFILVFVVVAFAGGLAAWLTKKAVDAVGLRPVDRTLGAAFGFIRGAVVLMAFSVVVGLTPLKTSDWWQQSLGAGVLQAALRGMKPLLPDDFAKHVS
jgi:membrane protein required for colicin V production